MQPRVVAQEPRDAPMRDKLPMDPYHMISQQYDDDFLHGLNFLGYSMEATGHHLSLASPDGAPANYTYISTWEE